MRIAVTGSNGLVGSALVPALAASNHHITRVVRSASNDAPSQIRWDPESGFSIPSKLENLDAVVHLAAANLASGRWTPARKAQIHQSRVRGTQVLAEALARLKRPPRVLLSASAVGFYGDRGDEVLTEQSPPGEGFLADVCRAWEAATAPAEQAGLRVLHLRFGIILSTEGGALAKMLPPFRLGLGGRLGHGRQYWSWIAMDDVLEAFRFCLASEALSGAVNFSAPQVVTNREFTSTLAKVLRRPAFLPAPALALRLALGDMADEALLASTRAVPAKLTAAGFRFSFPDLEGAFSKLLAP